MEKIRSKKYPVTPYEEKTYDLILKVLRETIDMISLEEERVRNLKDNNGFNSEDIDMLELFEGNHCENLTGEQIYRANLNAGFTEGALTSTGRVEAIWEKER